MTLRAVCWNKCSKIEVQIKPDGDQEHPLQEIVISTFNSDATSNASLNRNFRFEKKILKENCNATICKINNLSPKIIKCCPYQQF